MYVSDTSFPWLQQANDERFTRELEYRRVAEERRAERRAARRRTGGEPDAPSPRN